MNLYLLDEAQREKVLSQVIPRLREALLLLRKVLGSPVYVDYEQWVKERSINLFGEVKEFYSPAECAKLLGVNRSSIHYRIRRGLIKTLGGRIPFDEVVLLAEYYRTKDLLEELENELYPKGFERSNRQNR